MLPGLRFLFAATLISASLLVFGMGAIALMRASHQQFASLPPRQPPEPVFAQAPQTVPSLSMLQIEPSAAMPRDVSPEPERIASLTNAERAGDPPAPPIITETRAPDATETRSDVSPRSDVKPPADPPPMPEVTPLGEQQSVSDTPETAVAEAPAAKAQETPPAPATPETAPSQPAQIAAAPEVAAPAATGSIAMPEDQPVAEQQIANPPLPETRPEVATVTPAASTAPAKVTPKPIVKRKARKTKRYRAKTEKLPAVSSAPTLGSLFSSSSGN